MQIRYRMAYFIGIVLSFLLSQSVIAMGSKMDAQKATSHAIARYGLPVESNLVSKFKKRHVAYPPRDIALLAFKQEQKVQLWARDVSVSRWRFIHTYPLTAYSGRLGPKLKERDRQIPEGIYRLTSLNPLSNMHLSMQINYPNEFDRQQASREGRQQLGGNIFIHGKALSVGCLAIGDKAIDELFLLVYRVGLTHAKVIIAPNDLRYRPPATAGFAQPRWLPELYTQIAAELRAFPVESSRYASSGETTKIPGALRRYSL